MTIVRVIGWAMVVVTLTAAPRAVFAQSEKASRACRKQVGASLSKIANTDLAVIDACHKSRDKGKFSGDCNDLATADVKGKIAKARAGALKSVGKKCTPGNLVLGNYDQADPVGVFSPVAENSTEMTGAALLGSPALVGDKAKIKCHAEISKTLKKDISEILKAGVKCQNSLDKTAVVFGELAADCVVSPVKSGPKGETSIQKKCTGITGADVGSCDPLPTCVTAQATAAGQALVAAIYGEPTPGCGNHIVDAGEECDDGNQISTDGCIDCKLATCGDGFVHAGVEVCGDTGDACTAPSIDTCQIPACTPTGTMESVTVRFSKPAATTVGGLSVTLDYPESQVRIPGSAGDATVTGRITNLPPGLTAVNDLDYEVLVSVVSTGAIDAGDLFTVSLDDCGTAPTLDEFACIVNSASSDLGADITSQVKCSVVTP